MNDKIVKKIGIRQDTGKYIYANIGVDADKVEIDEFTTLVDKLEEFDDKINNIEVGNIASEEVLGGVKIGNGLEISEDGILNCTSSGSTDNTIELSKAEYDALPEDKLTNNITYFIKDMEIPSGSGDGSAIYDGDGNVITSTYAKKSIYDNNAISYGRKVGSAVGEGSIAFGLDVEAPINYGVAVGVKTRAGDCAFACGHTNSANGLCSSASGFNTTVDGEYSHVEGVYTKASSNCQHVQGKYNVEDTEHKYAHIIGGGNSETDRKNIHTIDWNGNADFAGEVKCSNVLKTLTECEASTTSTDIAGASALAELKDDFKSIILNSAYPVGTVYMSTKNTSPATFLGGTWSAISADKYLKTITSGTGGSTTSGSTTLTTNQIPSHSHSDLLYGTGGGKIGLDYSGASGSNQYSLTVGGGTSITTQTTGSGQGHTHTINPPYYSVYAWVRTA